MNLFGNYASSVTNFSIQYNYACAGIATAIMLSDNDMIGPGIKPDYPEPRWATNFLLSIVFVGSIAGMLIMGTLGDMIGPRRALIVTNSFVVFGALASALCSWGTMANVWRVITISRFILGVGVGGGYPLSAALAAESAQPGKSTTEAVKAFFWQGPGSLAPYLVAIFLLRLPPWDGVTSVQFRSLFAFGAVPAILVVVASWERGDGASKVQARRGDAGSSALMEALQRPEYLSKLAGTAGTWFLFDVALYSIVIYAPTILARIFGSQSSLDNLVLRAATTGLLATVGAACGITAVMRKALHPKMLNILGFTAASLLFACLSVTFSLAPDNHLLMFWLFCGTFFVLYAGPQVGTFAMPVVSFPSEVRGTFGGISAAAGKLGAMFGVLAFPLAEQRFGMALVMAFQASFCFAAALLSYVCLDDGDEGEDSETRSLLSGNKADAIALAA